MLIAEFVRLGSDRVKVPALRMAGVISELIDLLAANEKYLARFDEIMIEAGKRKKEGLDVSYLPKLIAEAQADFSWMVTLARFRVGIQG